MREMYPLHITIAQTPHLSVSQLICGLKDDEKLYPNRRGWCPWCTLNAKVVLKRQELELTLSTAHRPHPAGSPTGLTLPAIDRLALPDVRGQRIEGGCASLGLDLWELTSPRAEAGRLRVSGRESCAQGGPPASQVPGDPLRPGICARFTLLRA